MILLAIPGIYLSIAYGMTLPLLAFNELGAWQAMEASRKAITHHWWRIFPVPGGRHSDRPFGTRAPPPAHLDRAMGAAREGRAVPASVRRSG